METNWIETEIAKGLQGLLCLSLDRQPALELIEGTLAMWCKVVTNGRVFDERRDTPRFRAAFMTLAGRRTWPVPQDFIEALPSNVTPIHKPKLLDDERTKQARLVAFKEIEKILHPKKPDGGDAA